MDFLKWLVTSAAIAISGIFGAHQAAPIIPQTASDPQMSAIEQHVLDGLQSKNDNADPQSETQLGYFPVQTVPAATQINTTPVSISATTKTPSASNAGQDQIMCIGYTQLSCAGDLVTEQGYAACLKTLKASADAKLNQQIQRSKASGKAMSQEDLQQYEQDIKAAEHECDAQFGDALERSTNELTPIASCIFPVGCKIRGNPIPVISRMSSLGESAEILVGESATMTFSVYDPTGEAISARVEWGDGTSSDIKSSTAPSSLAVPMTRSAAHMYTKPGDYVILISVIDSAGNTVHKMNVTHVVAGVTVRSFSLTSDGASSHLTHAGDRAVFVLSILAPDSSAYPYSIDWGDGSGKSSGVVSKAQPANPSHVFAPGAYAITATVSSASNSSEAAYQVSVENKVTDESLIRVESPNGGESYTTNETSAYKLPVAVRVNDPRAYNTANVYLEDEHSVAVGGFIGIYLGTIDLKQPYNQGMYSLGNVGAGVYKVRIVGARFKNCDSGQCIDVLPDDRSDGWIKIAAPSSGTTDNGYGPYQGYKNNQLFIDSKSITRGEALLNCTRIHAGNPASSVRCVWNGEEIYNKGPIGTHAAS